MSNVLTVYAGLQLLPTVLFHSVCTLPKLPRTSKQITFLPFKRPSCMTYEAPLRYENSKEKPMLGALLG